MSVSPAVHGDAAARCRREALPRSACALACAARDLRSRASRFDVLSDETAPMLAAIADALDDLDGALAGFGARDGFRHAGDDPDAVAALRWHLAETARRARAAKLGCEECARWARRLSEIGDPPAGEG